MEKKLVHMAFFTLIMTILLCLALQLIDIAVSANQVGKEVILQSLIFDRVEPRIAYHAGFLMIIGIWTITVLVFLYQCAD